MSTITREKLMEAGIDELLIDSILKNALKPKKTGKKKFFPGMTEDKPKKFVGRLLVKEVCLTCGSSMEKYIITQIDPNKDEPGTVHPVNICSGCIVMYRTLDHEALISLTILKDHPDVNVRMLSNKQQLAYARKLTPEAALNLRVDASGYQERPEPTEVVISVEKLDKKHPWDNDDGIKKEEFTCNDCPRETRKSCAHAWDTYNTCGDCLAEK